MHSYIDILCERIINLLKQESSKYTISDAILEESFQYAQYKGAISSIDEPNKDNLRIYLYHRGSDF